ncbi:hypothetical protein EMGBS8_18450 [Verrucomicrobiota bacterium]|nr:hypothetical protein EMGBS8_18450 [Verrucomicrobiota bacterium]
MVRRLPPRPLGWLGTAAKGSCSSSSWKYRDRLVWFGTNLLGVGLHSYGFTESGAIWLYYIFCPSQLALIAVGWLPARAAKSVQTA